MNDCHILSRQRKRSASKSSLPGCVPSTLLPLSISEHSVPEHKLATATSNIFTHSSKKPSYYRYTQLDELWAQTDRVCNDEPDVSHHPSYTITKFSYNLNCHLRYKDATKRYNNQLKREIANFVASRRSICDQHFARSKRSNTLIEHSFN
ncbi:uncharacterized protein LOC115624228 isoform X2 [Scaptodrosophila lebanonensis]|uniref:Uncharacterized protein LOC115624228 isoform X2 n=1 Tax=Drosophila lebanonensis TaxID=7225 RepID=A0A6J2TFD1_DROLE|nr:uncharacterized protein LOC115624228 isoform X2 [Scaptodrosophila lebanonensis]